MLKKVIPKLTSNMAQRFYLFLIISVWFLGLFSYTSPLYYFDYSPDNNAFFTVGKAMMHGIVPYKDLFEQKGPYLYFLHGIASLFASHSLIGMFPFEVLSLTMTIWFTYKIARLFVNDTHSIMIAVFSPVVYLIHPYFNYGDTTESLLFPFTVYLIYLVILNEQTTIKNGFDRFNFTNLQWYALGLMVAIIFLSKYTQLGGLIVFYLFVAFFYLKHKQYHDMLKMFNYSLAGFLTGTIPWLLYFIATNSFGAFIHTYFYENITIYGNTQYPIYSNVLQAVNVYSDFIRSNPLVFILGLLGLAYVLISRTIFKTQLGKILFMTMNMGNAILAVYGYSNSQAYLYYELAFMPYLFIPFVALMTDVFRHFKSPNLTLNGKKLEDYNNITILATILLSFVMVLSVNSNFESSRIFPNNASVTLSTDTKRHQPAQVVFGKIIRDQTGEDTTLLNYGSIDMGFYTAAGVLPSQYYFQNYNISQVTHPQIIDAQVNAIINRKVEWVVLNTMYGVPVNHWYGAVNSNGKISGGNLNTGTSGLYKFLHKNYYYVAQHSQSFENQNVTYWLFRKRVKPLEIKHTNKKALLAAEKKKKQELQDQGQNNTDQNQTQGNNTNGQTNGNNTNDQNQNK